jgi:hypothetical protein
MMIRISRFSVVAAAFAAAVSLVDFAPRSQSSAQAGPIVDILSGGYYGGYGPGYGGYSGYGYSPYGYRTAPGYVYPSNNAYGYGRGDPYYDGPARSVYYARPYRPVYSPYGYGGYRSYGGSPNFGHAYSPYGYGSYSAYGY